jgi:hypothetical protein
MANSKGSNYYIWIEAEQWLPGQWNPKDCNSDVIVSFEKSGEWVATFVTYDNVKTLANKNRHSGECLNGRYFWATDMLLVDELTRERIEEVVADLISTCEFEKVFSLGRDI